MEDDDVFDKLDDALAQFNGVVVEGGADPDNDEDACAGGACKI